MEEVQTKLEDPLILEEQHWYKDSAKKCKGSLYQNLDLSQISLNIFSQSIESY